MQNTLLKTWKKGILSIWANTIEKRRKVFMGVFTILLEKKRTQKRSSPAGKQKTIEYLFGGPNNDARTNSGPSKVQRKHGVYPGTEKSYKKRAINKRVVQNTDRQNEN